MTTPIPATPFADPAPAQRLQRAAAALTASMPAMNSLVSMHGPSTGPRSVASRRA